jgi:hypothetical protein
LLLGCINGAGIGSFELQSATRGPLRPTGEVQPAVINSSKVSETLVQYNTPTL